MTFQIASIAKNVSPDKDSELHSLGQYEAYALRSTVKQLFDGFVDWYPYEVPDREYDRKHHQKTGEF